MAAENRLSVYLIVLGIVAVGALVGSWLTPSSSSDVLQAPVISGSMDDAAPGPHYALECYDCRIPFRVDASTVNETNLPICFNCGATNAIEDIPTQLNTVRFESRAIQELQRWDEVVFEYDSEKYLKRVIGLPGEEVVTESGELYINNQLYQKSLEEFDQLSVDLFDSRYQPSDPTFSLLRRFGVRGEDEGWIYTLDKSFSFDAPAKTHPQWLDYHQWNIVAGFVPPAPRGSSSAIFDYLPYNQFISRSRLNFVDDFVVNLELKIFQPGVVRLRLLDVEVEIDFHLFNVQVSQSAFLRSSAKVAPIQWEETGIAVPLRIGRLDGRVVVQIQGNTEYYPMDPLIRTGDFESDTLVRKTPFSIAADEGVLDLNLIMIARDIYWLGMDYSSDRWQAAKKMTSEEYFLVGDNQPVSRDCRHWGEGITREAIIGVVIKE